MNRKGITLVEVLCIVAVLFILSAALLPVLKRSTLEAKADAAKQNLKGFWKGILLYQSDCEQKTMFGKAADMGLPPSGLGWAQFCNQYTGDTQLGWATKSTFLPCGNLHDSKFGVEGLGYMVSMLSDWPRDVVKFQEDTVVLYDKNCNDPGTQISSQSMLKRSIGITLGGQIKDRTQKQLLYFDQRFYR